MTSHELINKLYNLKSPYNMRNGQAYLEFLEDKILKSNSLDEIFELTNNQDYTFIDIPQTKTFQNGELEYLFEYIKNEKIPFVARYKKNTKTYQVILFKKIVIMQDLVYKNDNYSDRVVDQERTSFILRSVEKLSNESLKHIIQLFNEEKRGSFTYMIIFKIFELPLQNKKNIQIINFFSKESIRYLYGVQIKKWSIDDVIVYKDFIPLDILTKEHKKEYLISEL